MYNRALHDKHMEAVDAATATISAAVAGSEYAGRLERYLDDYTEIAEMFWARCPITKKKLETPGKDVRDVARVFHRLVIGGRISGLETFKLENTLERCRRKIKGRLFTTRMILAENDAKPKCQNPDEHKQPCRCRPLRLHELAEKEADSGKQM